MNTQTHAELLLASKNSATGVVLYTWRLTFPRIILAEINTHRMLSRNTSSSRAIPSKKMRKAVRKDTFIPVSIGANQKGMQAGAEIKGLRRKLIETDIRVGAFFSAFRAWRLEFLGAHKQVSNRYLEPFSWTVQILSATEVDNLFLQRNHGDAEPHFHILADQMQLQTEEAESEFARMEYNGIKAIEGKDHGLIAGIGRLQILEPGEWHLPMSLKCCESLEDRKRIDAARCARTSYTLLDTGRVPSNVEDLSLCAKLFGGAIKHLSPTEHQAQAMEEDRMFANFCSFQQFRAEVENC